MMVGMGFKRELEEGAIQERSEGAWGHVLPTQEEKHSHPHQNTKGDPRNGKCKLPTPFTIDRDFREEKYEQVLRLPWGQRAQH
uniref:Uncharacterized protein n=1 Tax=Tanacetum cinerariifolium TaxID=118510 RepID=A0A699IGT0_TANCI|nr:hypothetical protein [Tanacetum cinerariifolium]